MKKRYMFLITFVVLITLIILTYFLYPKKYVVLTYHDFTTLKPENSMQKNIKDFEKEMKFLKRHHYKSLKLSDVECYFDGKCSLPRKSVLITFDDGWINEYKLALPILKKYNLNAVIFYIGKNADGSNGNFISDLELEDIKKNYPNIEIASHSYNLHNENDFTKSKDEINQDFKIMNSIIKTNYYAYPFGKDSSVYKEVLKENNYKLAFGFGPDSEHRKFSKKDDRYKIPRLNVSTTYSYFKYVLRLVLPF